jgi:hypothetical protein
MDTSDRSWSDEIDMDNRIDFSSDADWSGSSGDLNSSEGSDQLYYPAHDSSSGSSVHNPAAYIDAGKYSESDMSDQPRKKRKIGETGLSYWADYLPPNVVSCELYDINGNSLIDGYDLRIHFNSQKMETLDIETKPGWAVFRQNSINIECMLSGHHAAAISKVAGSSFLYNGIGLVPVASMYIIVYAVKQSHKEVISSYNQVAVEERVPILVMSSTRAKRDAKCVQPTLLENGAVGFKNLQFQYSTQNAKKNESIQVQQYFRVVVSLVAISQEKEPQHYHLMSRMSPPIIVRGQNPGRYSQSQVPVVQQQPAGGATPAAAATDPEVTVAQWQKKHALDPVAFFNGRVGINTDNPHEALTVNGNVLVTGTVLKPSDERIKQNIEIVNPRQNLENLKKISIYDYDVITPDDPDGKTKAERGVIAQEVQRAIPSAVEVLGDVSIRMANGETKQVKNLLVVNDHALLVETIGATKALDYTVTDLHSNVHGMKRDLIAETSQVKSYLAALHQYLSVSEDDRGNKECLVLSIFGLDTPYSLFMMGWLVPLVPWFLGMFYMCSNVRSKRIAGGLNFVFFFLYSCVQALLMLLPMIDKSRNYDFRMLGMSGSYFLAIISFVTFLVCCVLAFQARRKRRQLEQIRRKLMSKKEMRSLLRDIELQEMKEENVDNV